jgi:Flp pilus assembly protein TadD
VRLAAQALAAEPQDRPGDAGALAEQLIGYLESVESRLRRAELARAAEEARALEARATAAQERRARRWRMALAAFVLLALAGGLAAGLWFKREKDLRALEEERQEALRASEEVRQASLTQTVVAGALQEAAQLRRLGQWAEARTALARAEERLRGSLRPHPELNRQVERGRADLKMVTRLEALRMRQAEVAGTAFDYAGTDRDYQAAFAQYGVPVEKMAPDEAARRIPESAIREPLVAALDYWIFVRRRGNPEKPVQETMDRAVAVLGDLGLIKARASSTRRDPLWIVANKADSDSWRQQLRDPVVGWSRLRLEQLAQDKGVLDQPPTNLALLGRYLRYSQSLPRSVALLRKAQWRHPTDFWINMELALAVLESGPPASREAAGFYRAALALRPNTPVVYNNLGVALRAHPGKHEDAIAAFRKALELQPEYLLATAQLAQALINQGELEQAEEHLRKAIRRKPDPGVYMLLAVTLQQRGE